MTPHSDAPWTRAIATPTASTTDRFALHPYWPGVTPLRISKHGRALDYHDEHDGRQVFSHKRGSE